MMSSGSSAFTALLWTPDPDVALADAEMDIQGCANLLQFFILYIKHGSLLNNSSYYCSNKTCDMFTRCFNPPCSRVCNSGGGAGGSHVYLAMLISRASGGPETSHVSDMASHMSSIF